VTAVEGLPHGVAPRRRWPGLLALAVALGFGSWAVATRKEDLAVALPAIGADRAAVALAFAALGVLCTGECWRRLLRGLGGTLPPVLAHRVFYMTQAGKYVPGSVWPFLAQDVAARRHGVPRRSVHTATVGFLLLHLATALVLSAVLLLDTSAGHWWPLLLLGAVAAATPLLPGAAQVVARWLTLVRRPRAGDLAAATTAMLGAWLAYGAGLAVLLGPFAGPADAVRWGIGGAALAWAVGFLVVVAPAGAGGREVALLVALSPALDVGQALSVALVWRVATTLADLGLAGAAALTGAGRRP
jgi:glycosyltransferase 2 family protein